MARQDAALETLTLREQRRLLRAVQATRRDLYRAIRDAGPVDRRNLQLALLRLGPVFAALQARVGETLATSELHAVNLGLAHTYQVLRNTGGVPSLDAMQVRMAARLADYRSLALYSHSADRFTVDVKNRVQGQIVAGVLQQETEVQLAKRVAEATALPLPRAALVARMETNRAYNEVASQAVAELGDGWTRRIVEVVDAKNHPFSRAADGKMAPPGRAFRVPVSDVSDAARAMGRPVGTVLWPQVGGDYVGTALPAHYGERGRVVPYRLG